MTFEPRRLATAEFLVGPNHQFAKGETAQGTVARNLEGTMRQCRQCHDADAVHDWLPFRALHFARLSCESCHIPKAYAPALQQIDWTLIDPQGSPSSHWRGIDGKLSDPSAEVTGFQPVLLPRKSLHGLTRLTPFNLVASWYWVQAIAILLLLWTGLCIHNPDCFLVFSFQWAIKIHNVLGFVVLGNAIFGMFYYWTTGTIQQHLPQPHGFMVLAAKQVLYYTGGIFRDEPHPLQKSPQHRLNPLQQAAYLVILNVLLPIQLVTGILMWSGQEWPETVLSVGGIQTLAAIHGLCAWLFGGFIIAHIYLTTTGHTPLSNFKAMILGYEDVPVEHAENSPIKIADRSTANHGGAVKR